MLTGLGTDYTLMGGQWDNSRTITYSVAPDGVTWAAGVNNINATLNAQFGGSGWQSLIARALQTWASVTNLNFSQVGDGAYNFNAPGVNEGDPDFGDIRLGGSNFGTTATIAQTYGPPPNGTTGAGDVDLNTGFNFTPGSWYDLETVLIHELGHSLGLGESPQSASVMYSNYQGARQSLSSYDIEGIQSIYGARSADVLQARGIATSAATALDLTSALNSANWGQLAGLSLQTIGDTEYFSVVAPQQAGATLDVAAIAQGFSLLSPKVTVIDPTTGATLASNSNPSIDGGTALGSVANVQAGHRYLIAVTGATGDVFSVGSYGLQFGFFGGTSLPPASDGLPYNQPFSLPMDLGANNQPTIFNLTLPTAQSYQLFSFETTSAGPVLISTLGANAVVTNAYAQPVDGGAGVFGFVAPGAGKYYLILLSPNNAPVYNYAFAVRTYPTTPVISARSITPTSPTPAASAISTTVQVESNAVGPVVSAATPSGPSKLTRPAQSSASVLRLGTF